MPIVYVIETVKETFKDRIPDLGYMQQVDMT